MKRILSIIMIAIILCGCSNDDNTIVQEKPIGIEGTWALIGFWDDGYVDISDEVSNYLVIGNTSIENYFPNVFDMYFEYIDGVLYGDDIEVFEKVSTAKYNLTGDIYRILEHDIGSVGVYDILLDESGWYMQLKDDRLIVTNDDCDGMGDDKYYLTWEYMRVNKFENK